MSKKMIIGISAAAMAAGIGVGATSLANAETTSPTPSATASQAPEKGTDDSGREKGGGPERGGHRGGGFDTAALASKLGVEEAAVTDALKSAREATKPEEGTRTAPTEAERTAREAAFAKALASELKLDEQKVTDALAELRAAEDAQRTADQKEALAQAVTDGKLTQSEADAVQKALDAGIVSMRGGHKG